jgi:hypothetical protein
MLSMFDLARRYKETGVTAYSRLQEKEFSRETEYGYAAVKHPRFVRTGYFDQVQHVISGGLASTTALVGSTKAEQFGGIKPLVHPEHGPDAGCQPILGDYPHTPVQIETNQEEPRY